MLRWHRPLVVFGLAMAVLVPITLIGLVADDRVLTGTPIWFKPLKFSISFVLYSFTLAWFLTFLDGRLKRFGWWAGTIIAAASAIEMTVIVTQVVRGRRSHFNFETPLDGALFSVMGATIVVLWVMHAAIAILLLRTKFENQAMAWSIRLGVIVAFFGLGVAFLMIGPKPGQDVKAGIIGAHSVGAPDGGAYMALTGWSTEAGDLRLPHFIGMHAVQVLPVLIALLGRWASVRLAWVLGAGYFGVLALTTWQALRGQSLIHPDSTTLLALAVLVAATAIGAVWARTPNKELVGA